MPAQWTEHLPQAMQRHGASARPEERADCSEAMARLIQPQRMEPRLAEAAERRADPR